MAKRSSKPKPAPSGNVLERQVEAFAEQLGYVAGSIESRAVRRVGAGFGVGEPTLDVVSRAWSIGCAGSIGVSPDQAGIWVEG